MANKDGVITKKDLIERDALQFGVEYQAQLNKMVEANNTLIDSSKRLNKQIKGFKLSDTNKKYIEQKKEQAIVNKNVIDSIKIQEQAEISLLKIEKAAISNKKAALGLAKTQNAERVKTVKLTVDEKVQQQFVNRQLKQEAIERLGLQSAYQKLNGQRAKAKNTLRDLQASQIASTKEIKRAQIEYDKLDKKVRKIDRSVGDFSKSVGNYGNRFSSLGAGLLSAFGIVGGISLFAGVVKNVFSMTKELQSLDGALKQVTDTQDNFANQQAFLQRISEAYGTEINSLTKSFTQFYVSAKDKLAGNEIQGIFESVTKAGAKMGLTVDAQERAFLALNQMMSKGAVQSEELRGQLGEALPGAFGIMAKALGVNEKQLGKMLEQGQVLAADVLPKFAKQLEKTYGIENINRIENLVTAQNRLSNSWTNFIRSLDTDQGVLSRISKWLIDTTADTVNFYTNLNKGVTIFQGILNKKEENATLTTIKQIKEESEKTGIAQEKLAKRRNELAMQEVVNYEWSVNNLKELAVVQEKTADGWSKYNLNNPFSAENKKRKGASEELEKTTQRIKELSLTLSFWQGVLKGTNQILDTKTADTPPPKAQTDADIKKRLSVLKRASDAEFALNKQRLEQLIQINDEIASNDRQENDVRTQATKNRQGLEKELQELTKKNKLDQDKFVLASERLTANEKIRINEDTAFQIFEIEKKASKDIEEINKFDFDKYKTSLTQRASFLEESLNQELLKEQNAFNALTQKEQEREDNIDAHERRVFDIKQRYLKASLKSQLDSYKAELLALGSIETQDEKTTARRIELAEKISKTELQLAEAKVDVSKKKKDEILAIEKELADKIKQTSLELVDALQNLTQAITSGKIQDIDEEIQRNDEFYARQIELAQDDSRNKEILEAERERKRQLLEKKKRKEQERQAKLDKAFALAKIAFDTLMAVSAVASTGGGTRYADFGVSAGILTGLVIANGAAQAAAVLATPLPRYKDGRKGGKKETAIVGDGGVHEIIERQKGGIELTPKKDTIVNLERGDNVYSSVDEYLKTQKSKYLNTIQDKGKYLSKFDIIKNQSDKRDQERLNILKETLDFMKKQKKTTVVNIPKIDINHEVWKQSNIN